MATVGVRITGGGRLQSMKQLNRLHAIYSLINFPWLLTVC